MSGPSTAGSPDSGDAGGPPCLAAYDTLAECPPSAKYVAYVLLARGPLTQERIIRATGLPSRTTRYALQRLDDTEDILVKRPCLQDARKLQYSLDLG